jgi:DNA repair protein RecN (Recombination protein N)
MWLFEYNYFIKHIIHRRTLDGNNNTQIIFNKTTNLDSATEKFSALEDVDVEEVLNRIEAISGLKRRYGL